MIFESILKKRKYTSKDILKIVFKLSPIYVCLKFLLILIDALLLFVSVYVTAQFIDSALAVYKGELEITVLITKLVMLIGFLVFQMFYSKVINIIMSKHQLRLSCILDDETLRWQSALRYEYLDNKDSFMLIQRTINGFTTFVSKIFDDFMNIVNILARSVSVIILFVSYGIWWVSLIFIISIIPLVIISYKNGVKIYKFYQTQYSADAELYHSSYVLTSRTMVDERTLYGFADEMNEYWENGQKALADRRIKFNKKIVLTRNISAFVKIIVNAIMIGMLIFMALDFCITIGAFIACVNNITNTVNYLIDMVLNFADHVGGNAQYLADLNKLHMYQTDIIVSGDTLAESEKKIPFESLEFRHVTFTYPGSDRKVLDDVSFEIKNNVSYAFVGKNGAGKSTIIKLILRLYDEYSGDILLNGINIKAYSRQQLYTVLGVIHQDFAKYELSVKEYLNLGNIQNIGKDELLAHKRDDVIKKVGLDELIAQLENKEDTHLGKLFEDGQAISGGEWQRLAIAQLLMGDYGFYILDEPTASLDPRSESEVYTLFRKINANKASLLISHRLGSIKNIDYIFVIDNGKIVEEGTHQQLIHHDGLYALMYNDQKEWYT